MRRTTTTTRRAGPATTSARVAAGALATLGVLAVLVAAARWAWGLSAVQAFVARYPGVATGAAWEGDPAWVVTLHALNLLLVVLAVRSGLAIRGTRRPAGHWTRRRRSGAGRNPVTITVEQWFHVCVEVLWIACGVAYVLLLAITGRWVRLVPTSWDVLPSAASVALQYLAWHWPHGDTWAAYNALQMLCYLVVVVVLAPLAVVSGLRISALWPGGARAGRVVPIEWARAVHYPTMLGFVGFAAVHVAMVLSTGAARNLDHMFAGRDDESCVGIAVLAALLAVLGGAWAAARPAVLRQLAALTGKVTR